MHKEAWQDLPFADNKKFDMEKIRLWKIENGIR